MTHSWVHTALRWHALVFALLNGFLAAINFVFTPDTWWFLWVTGTWGMALVLHAFAAYSASDTPTAPRVSSGRRRSSRRRGDDDSDAPTLKAMGLAATQLHSAAPTHPQTPIRQTPTGQASRDAITQPLPSHVPALSAGQRLADRFTIERALGAGGMGEVYVAHDALLNETVALKTIATSLAGDSAVERFRREAQAARRISHPNVVRIHDIGQDGGLTFISMEYVVGETLGQRVHRMGILDLDTLKPIALQLCSALQAAHVAGVIHRDLKPDNILLDGRGQVRVIDFGLARLDTNDGLTVTGTVMGTPNFMAPEQMLAQAVDERTDIYALGCVLHYALVGTPPFVGETPVAVGIAHCHDAPSSLIPRRPDLPDGWDALVLRALEKSPDKRFQSAADLSRAIETL